MKPESIVILKDNMVNTFRKYGDEKAIRIKGKKAYSGNEIADEIQNETELGIDMVNSIIQLTIDLIQRDKIHVKAENE